MTRNLLLTLSLLLANGCANCGEKEEEAALASRKPEPPVIIHPKLADGGRGKAKIIDVSERPSPFEAGTPADPP